MTKENKKLIKEIIKKIRKHYIQKYNDIINYLLSNEEELSRHIEEVNLLVNNEPYYYDEIESIKLQLEIEKKEEEFQTKVNSNKTVQEYIFEYLEEQQFLNQEYLQRIETNNVATEQEIKQKEGKIEKIKSRIAIILRTKEKIQEVMKEFQPKRKVGRPKKNSV